MKKIVAMGLCISLLCGASVASLSTQAFAAEGGISPCDGYTLSDKAGKFTVVTHGDRGVRVIITKDCQESPAWKCYDVTLDEAGEYEFILDSCEFDEGYYDENGKWVSVLGTLPVEEEDIAEVDDDTELTDTDETTDDSDSDTDSDDADITDDTTDDATTDDSVDTDDDNTASDTTEDTSSPYETRYLSSYTITVQDIGDSDCAYSESGIIVYDTGFSREVSATEYYWDVTSIESEETRDISAAVHGPYFEDGVWSETAVITLEYLAYTLGDVNGDGNVDPVDAHLVLVYYASNNVGTYKFSDGGNVNQSDVYAEAAADVDKDGSITPVDAHKILLYYAYQNIGQDVAWEDLD